MKKADLTNAVLELVQGEGLEFTKKDLTAVIDKVFEAVQNGLVDGEEVPVGVLGKFVTVDKPERQARNIQTGEAITVPAHRAVKYKPSKGTKEAVR